MTRICGTTDPLKNRAWDTAEASVYFRPPNNTRSAKAGKANCLRQRDGCFNKRYNHSRFNDCQKRGARFTLPAITSRLPPTPIASLTGNSVL